MDDFNREHNTVEGTVPQQDLPEYNMPQDFASNDGYRPPDSVTAPYQPVDYQQSQYQQQYMPQYSQPTPYYQGQFVSQPLKQTAYAFSIVSLVCGILSAFSVLFWLSVVALSMSGSLTSMSPFTVVFGFILAFFLVLCPLPCLVFGIISLVMSGKETQAKRHRARHFGIAGLVLFGSCILLCVLFMAISLCGVSSIYV